MIFVRNCFIRITSRMLSTPKLLHKPFTYKSTSMDFFHEDQEFNVILSHQFKEILGFDLDK
jgi:hypothetical protein